MPFEVLGWAHDRLLSANAETAEEAFATAVKWHVARNAKGVSISDGSRRFTVAEFSWAMASREIADTARQSRRTAATAYSI
jgi:hypothetical protein